MAGGSTSDAITFRNPFNDTMEVVLDLRTSDVAARKSAFLLLKKARSTVPPLAAVQIPFSFSPTDIAEIRATLVRECYATHPRPSVHAPWGQGAGQFVVGRARVRA